MVQVTKVLALIAYLLFGISNAEYGPYTFEPIHSREQHNIHERGECIPDQWLLHLTGLPRIHYQDCDPDQPQIGIIAPVIGDLPGDYAVPRRPIMYGHRVICDPGYECATLRIPALPSIFNQRDRYRIYCKRIR